MRPLMNRCEIAVIGGGMAGLAAAREALRLGGKVILFEGSGLFGGQVATVNEIEGFPVPGVFSGQDLAMSLLGEAGRYLFQVVEEQIAEVRPEPRLTLIDTGGRTYHPEAVIVASGASPRRLGVPGEEDFVGRGVSRCASCDGGFYRNRDVAVVGGGDAAVTEALVLARLSRRVVMVCRGPLRAKREYVDRLVAQPNVEFVWDSEVVEVLGEQSVTGLRLRNVRSGALGEVDCWGVFPYIGVEPNTGFLPAPFRDDRGRVLAGPGFVTADLRIFAVGAARAGFGGTLTEAMAEGIGAAQAAQVARRLAA